MPLRRKSQQIEIKRIVAILEKGPLSPIAPLGHMMRNMGITMRGSRAITRIKQPNPKCRLRGYRTCHRNFPRRQI
jgi:hypothetical protein